MNLSRIIVSSTAVLALSACVSAPSETDLSIPALPNSYSFAPGAQTEAALNELLPVRDPAYLALAEQALASSPTLAEALARVGGARAGASRAGADRLPSIEIAGAVSAQRTNPGQFGASLPAGIAIDNERISYAGNLTASWDPDLFGRLRNQEKAALARVDAATSSARAVRDRKAAGG